LSDKFNVAGPRTGEFLNQLNRSLMFVSGDAWKIIVAKWRVDIAREREKHERSFEHPDNSPRILTQHLELNE